MKFQHLIAKRLFSMLLPLAFLTVTAQAQETARIKLDSLDKLASRATEVTRKEEKGKGGDAMVYARAFEFSQAGEYKEADLQEIRAQLNAPGWSRMLKVEDKNSGSNDSETTEIYVFGTTAGSNVFGGMTVLVTEPKELTVANIVGQGKFEDILRQVNHGKVPD